MIPPLCTSSCALCRMSALMLKAIFRLTETEKQKIFKLREMGVRPSDIARRFGLSEGVVHKVIQAQRALLVESKAAPQRELPNPGDLHKQEAS
jgi:transposase-like protein